MNLFGYEIRFPLINEPISILGSFVFIMLVATAAIFCTMASLFLAVGLILLAQKVPIIFLFLPIVAIIIAWKKKYITIERKK